MVMLQAEDPDLRWRGHQVPAWPVTTGTSTTHLSPRRLVEALRDDNGRKARLGSVVSSPVADNVQPMAVMHCTERLFRE